MIACMTSARLSFFALILALLRNLWIFALAFSLVIVDRDDYRDGFVGYRKGFRGLGKDLQASNKV